MCQIIVDEELHLTPVRLDDADALIEYLNDPELYERTLRIPFPYAYSDAEAFLKIVDAEVEQRGHPIQFAIRNTAGKAIGQFGFEGLVYDHRVEIGYWLGRPYRNKGIMTRVVGKMCDYAFEHWRLVRITAHVFDFNDESARVLEKNKFAFEGALRKHLKKGDQYINTKLYALVR